MDGDAKFDSQSVFTRLAADASNNMTEVSGRYGFQADAERRILADVMAKLDIEPHHRVLDFGCGPGTLAIPLSFVSSDITAVDQGGSIELAKTRFNDSAVKWVVGGYPGAKLDGPYDRIVVYSMLQYLPNHAMCLEMIGWLVDMLAPGGRMLIGEMPNTDKRARFQQSAAGKAFAAEWEAMKASFPEKRLNEFIALNDSMDQVSQFNDAVIYEMMRIANAKGAHAYLLPEPADLPYGHTRDDLLIVRP